MKFISKNSNYRAILKHGLPAEPMTGRAAVSGMYAKFENGIFKTEDEEIIDLLKKHSGFGSDYIQADSNDSKDPYTRDAVEPEHDLIQIKHGSVVGNQNPKPKLNLNKEQQKILTDMAQKMAMEMLQKMVKDRSLSENSISVDTSTEDKDLDDVTSDNVENIDMGDQSEPETITKKKPGRKKKIEE